MVKKSGYLLRRQAELRVYLQAERDTYIQYMTDVFGIVLNSPEVMGKDTFGKERMNRIVIACGKAFDAYHMALEKRDDSDYYQIRLDERLRKIYGKDLKRFGERYAFIPDKTK